MRFGSDCLQVEAYSNVGRTFSSWGNGPEGRLPRSALARGRFWQNLNLNAFPPAPEEVQALACMRV